MGFVWTSRLEMNDFEKLCMLYLVVNNEQNTPSHERTGPMQRRRTPQKNASRSYHTNLLRHPDAALTLRNQKKRLYRTINKARTRATIIEIGGSFGLMFFVVK